MSDVLTLFKESKKDVPDIRCELPGSGKEIFMRPFTTREQKALLKALEKEDRVLLNEAFDQILRNCVTTPNFRPEDLYTKDREILLVELSKNSVTDQYTHNWTCDKCETSNSVKFNVDDLKYKDFVEGGIKEEIIELDGYDFTIKVSNPTREDEKKIMSLGKKEGGKSGVSQSEVITATYASVIKEYKDIDKRTIKDEYGDNKEVEREVFKAIKFEDRMKIYDGLSMTDKKKIETYFESVKSYGYDLSLGEQTCTKCPHQKEVSATWLDFFLM